MPDVCRICFDDNEMNFGMWILLHVINPVILLKCFFYLYLKVTDNEHKSVSNSSVEDGPGDGFTILSAKTLFLGQKVERSSTDILNVKQQRFVTVLMLCESTASPHRK